MNYMSSIELKAIARDKMLGKYGTAIGAFLFMRTIIVSLMMASSVYIQSYLLYAIVVLLLSLLEGVLIYGELSIYLKISVGMKTASADVFSGFSDHAKKAVMVKAVTTAISYTGAVLVSYVALLLENNTSVGALCLAIIAWIVIVAVTIYGLLTYSQAMYFLQDFEDMNVRTALKRSRELMKGNKLTLFWIYVGFIPLYFVGVVSMMVGVYFVHPYLKMTLTEFYLDRVRQMGIEEH